MRFLFIRHSPKEYDYTIEPVLAARGDRVDTASFAQGIIPRAASAYDAVVVFGGQMFAHQDELHPWIRTELGYMESVMKADVPLLGICLGGQLLARLLGARVYKAPVPEFGYHPVTLSPAGRASPLFTGFADSFPVFLWHSEVFDLPKGCTHLAGGEHWSQQAYAYGDRTFGTQFHLEFSGEHLRSMMEQDKDSLPPKSAVWANPQAVAGDDRNHELAGKHMLLLLDNLAALGVAGGGRK
ncbi:MAG TPA: type 1 glutamine amidotransferase [Spirochaetales bacterium]|nr:type 1 glutamine amidotransferase [Spirochaetales bacterium]